VEKMRAPKRITLTVPSGHDLAEQWQFLSRSFRCFLDTRLGPRNWERFAGQAREFLASHLANNELDVVTRCQRFEAACLSLDRFAKRLGRFHSRTGRWPRVRDVIGQGLVSSEVTYSLELGWHPHKHLVVDSGYIPWALLVVVWQKATKGHASIVDIRSLGQDRKSMREAIKYVTKPWEIPADKADELRRVLFGKKRVWPLGGAKPVDPEKVCPGCGRPVAECRPVGFDLADTFFLAEDLGLAVIRLRHSSKRLVLRRLDGRWQVQGLNLIPMRLACHSSPARAGPDPPG